MCLRRLIPAHAGKTTSIVPRGTTVRAHPRSRGENLVQFAEQAVNAGSSPLTRGKPCAIGSGLACRGLIPAHAGKTTANQASAFCDPGSSPLTRGKPVSAGRRVGPVGLIPAHAGKTRRRRGLRMGARAHPRSRGENGHGRGGPSADWGSSPLTRGKLFRPPAVIWRRWLIPAHAGKTRWLRGRRAQPRAHPRSRGENSQPLIMTSW